MAIPLPSYRHSIRSGFVDNYYAFSNVTNDADKPLMHMMPQYAKNFKSFLVALLAKFVNKAKPETDMLRCKERSILAFRKIAVQSYNYIAVDRSWTLLPTEDDFDYFKKTHVPWPIGENLSGIVDDIIPKGSEKKTVHNAKAVIKLPDDDPEHEQLGFEYNSDDEKLNGSVASNPTENIQCASLGSSPGPHLQKTVDSLKQDSIHARDLPTKRVRTCSSNDILTQCDSEDDVDVTSMTQCDSVEDDYNQLIQHKDAALQATSHLSQAQKDLTWEDVFKPLATHSFKVSKPPQS